jgi:hypothetical protein
VTPAEEMMAMADRDKKKEVKPVKKTQKELKEQRQKKHGKEKPPTIIVPVQ